MPDPSLDHIAALDPTNHRFEAIHCKVGEVNRVLTGEPNLKGEVGATYQNLLVEVEFPEGGFVTCPYHGAGIDRETKKLHGLYKTPVERQMVLVLFVNANYMSPLAAIDLPYTLYNADDQLEDFYPLQRLSNLKDIELGHRTGSVLRFKETGDVEVENWQDDASDWQSKLVMAQDGSVTIEQNGKARLTMDPSGNVEVELAASTHLKVDSGALNALIDSRVNPAFNRHVHSGPSGISGPPLDTTAAFGPMTWVDSNPAPPPGTIPVGTVRP